MVSCPQCEQQNPPEETYCAACGAALEAASSSVALTPLAPGTLLADGAYRIESSEALDFENRYHATRSDQPGTRVLLRERAGVEAEILRAVFEKTEGVSHPALVIPERFFEQGDRAYLVFPDIAGTRLSARVGLSTEREAVSWGIQLCQVVGALHRNGLLCVELPPDGVVLDKEGRVRLTHVESLSRKSEPLHLNVVVDGYAAPEVYKAGNVGEQVDVFAIGALLFSLVVGKRLPVEGWAVHAEPPVFYPEKVVSPDFERVLRKALAVEASARYESVDALKAALLTLTRFRRVRSAWFTDVGNVRDHNEDAVLVKEYGQGTVSGNTFAGLYIVSDGMGGAEAGEVASTLTIRTIARHVEQSWSEGVALDANAGETCIRQAVEAANAAILGYVQQHPEAAGMGATVVVALIQEQRLTLAWVGDSRAYVWERGVLRQISRDHSLVARLVEIGQLSPAEARTHEHRNVLLRSLGAREQVAVDVVSCQLSHGVRLMLCSDGLTGHVEDDALSDILSRHRGPYEAALELVAAANAGGGSDNISVVVVFYD
ncbi:MAG TPA: Stp1/IreP family PP2C-type Ser/Thr phosphatase [Methylomirabilota bacterium]|nr:Stp1/IreP family PP2C-type Ser/Thr phosphatase [Methylomirabilota bacterium]